MLVPKVTLEFLATRMPVELVQESSVTLDARDPDGFIRREEVPEAAWSKDPRRLATDLLSGSRPRPQATRL